MRRPKGAKHGGHHEDGRAKHHVGLRAVAHVRIEWAALCLWLTGHKRAAKMMRGWTAHDTTPAAIKRAAANFVRRFPGA